MLNIFTYTDTFEDQSRCHSFEEEEKEVALPSDSLMMMGFARGFPFFLKTHQHRRTPARVNIGIYL